MIHAMNRTSEVSVLEEGKERCLTFPEGFFWGCATSPTQVEGETVNEWATFRARDNTTPDDACHHWRRYHYDFRCLASMHLNAYRLGFDWGRLQGGPGEPLQRDASLRYLEMLAELRSLGIEPFLTLFHFACPVWMAEKGGWLHPESPRWFADFTTRLVELTDGEVRYWIPINEPMVYALMGYVCGIFPPQKKYRWRAALRVVRHLREGHALAYEAIKSRLPEAEVGIAKHFKWFSPLRPWHPVDRISAALAIAIFDRWGLRCFVRHERRRVLDFIGVNYYGRLRMKGLSALSPLCGSSPTELARHHADCDDMWEQDPDHLVPCLREVGRRYRLPLFITEYGVATEDESLRTRFLREHLRRCHEAIGYGIDLRGFFYWSLLDNFEWNEGLTKKYGLVAVDFSDPERRRDIRRTGCVYGEIARQNSLRISS